MPSLRLGVTTSPRETTSDIEYHAPDTRLPGTSTQFLGHYSTILLTHLSLPASWKLPESERSVLLVSEYLALSCQWLSACSVTSVK